MMNSSSAKIYRDPDLKKIYEVVVKIQIDYQKNYFAGKKDDQRLCLDCEELSLLLQSEDFQQKIKDKENYSPWIKNLKEIFKNSLKKFTEEEAQLDLKILQQYESLLGINIQEDLFLEYNLVDEENFKNVVTLS